MEDQVARLQKDIADYWKELRFSGVQDPANPSRPTKRSGFTSTPVPRYSGKSSWEQYRQVFEAIACSNGWDDVTAALQLLSHLDGDALNVTLLIPESQRVLSGVLMKSLMEHCGSPGRLGRRAFADIDSSIQLQMVRDRFIDGHAECALLSHLDSLGPDAPMRDIVDSCRVWESHNEAAIGWNGGSDRNSPRAVNQVTVDSQ